MARISRDGYALWTTILVAVSASLGLGAGSEGLILTRDGGGRACPR